MSMPLRVLIVEDSKDDVILLVHELQRGGLLVHYFEDIAVSEQGRFV